MNKCRAYRTMISRYIDNDLDTVHRTMLNGHFTACRECRAIVDAYLRMRSMIREHCRESAPEKAISGFIGVKPPAVRHFPFLYPALGWAASIVFAACMVTVFVLYARYHSISSPLIMTGAETSSIMNTPLGSIVYYEELAGKTANAGFPLSRDTEGSRAVKTEAVSIGAMGYESPLFHDNSLLKQRYEMLAGQ